MSQAIHQFYVTSAGCLPLASAAEDTGTARLKVYEVLRVKDRIPLFLEAHLSRLRRSVELTGRRFSVSDQTIRRLFRKLIFCNGVGVGNVRLEVAWQTEDAAEAGQVAVYFIPHAYPAERLYRDGVQVGLLRAERSVPNAKIEQLRLRERANALMSKHGYYEVLLVDQHDHITEGSRSNFFLIRDGEMLTPPTASVLPGITRSEVMNLCALLELPLRETDLQLAWLKDAEAAFLTGTSVGVLPVLRVEDHSLRVDHLLLQTLKLAYDERVWDYLAARRRAASDPVCY